MSVDAKTVRKIAHLARLEVAEDRLAPLADELNGILSWIEQLNEVDVEGVAPMASVEDVPTPVRADVVNDGNIRDDILANAPKTEEGFFVMPKAVE
ncbi:MAG: Asp-tRNA(Asn)/Glu-tRNA(Gln) amidotransferase GatCAB subunit C [Robiginitomaculum sp.]|nr:MAG: Asp-tRNA(Asn)/Glu-tRNA(Gln) amidotransferase GatCAB subunit C [Robiginitomaculum sp.]